MPIRPGQRLVRLLTVAGIVAGGCAVEGDPVAPDPDEPFALELR